MDLHLITFRPDWEFANINVISAVCVWTNGRILVVTFNKATDKMSEQVDYSPPIKIVTNFLNNSKF